MVKLKDLLKEGSPGYKNRQFGDPLPTLEDVMKEKNIKDLKLGKVYTDKDRPPFQVQEETINEAPEMELAKGLDKITDMIVKLGNRYKKKADVDGMVRSWMLGLKSKLKKAGIKSESINENDKVKVLKLLIKRGDNPKDAKKDVEKLYNKVSKMYKNVSNSKKAEIISTLSAKMAGK